MNLVVAMPIAVLVILAFLFISIKFLPSISGERFSSFASGTYNIVASIALVGAGTWAVINFELLKQKEQAEESLKLITNQKSLAQKQYEELLKKISNVEASKIEISTEIINYKGYYKKANQKGMSINVKLVNLGDSPIKFDLSEGVLKIYEVNAEGIESGYQKLYEPSIISELAGMGDPAGSTPLRDFVLLSSAERTLSYFAVLPINKLYYIVFKTKAEGLQGASKKECDKANGCSWFVSKYLYLEEEQDNS